MAVFAPRTPPESRGVGKMRIFPRLKCFILRHCWFSKYFGHFYIEMFCVHCHKEKDIDYFQIVRSRRNCKDQDCHPMLRKKSGEVKE